VSSRIAAPGMVLKALRPYVLSALAVAGATGIAMLAEQIGLETMDRPLYWIAVAISIWYFGTGPGVLATLLAILCFDFFFERPRYSLAVDPADRPYFAVFILFTLLVGWFAAQRRRIEDQLRTARDALAAEVVVRTRQASLLDLTHDTIFVRDLADLITYWNRGAEELYGWKREQAVGRKSHELLGTQFPEPEPQIRDKLLRDGRWEGELQHTTAAGARITVSSRWALQRDGAGQPLAVLETNNDITRRKHNEEHILQLNADLARRSAALEASNKELEAFAYSTSHDLRAPLRHIAGYSELLQKASAAALDDKGRRYVQMILESAQRMGRLIDDLLGFSRIGRAERQTGPVSLDQLVREVVKEVEKEADGRDIAWTIGELPAMRGDRSMLRLALVNLISNAVKFTSTRPQARIEIGSIGQGPEEFTVFVKDNGVGFDMKYLHKLFGVFQRLHRADVFEGTGIGLATVQRVIARHGERVWAEGAVDGGATFYFSLPRT
jgi:PAS domain S-box-containing protein